MYSHLRGQQGSIGAQVHRNLEEMRREARDNNNDNHLIAYVRCALQCRYGHLKEGSFYQEAKRNVQQEIDDNGAETAATTVRDITRYLCNQNNIAAFKAVYKGDEHGPEVTQFIQAASSTHSLRKMSDYVREFKDYKVSLPVTFAVLARFLQASQTAERRTIARVGHQVAQSLNALIMRTAAVRTSFAPSTIEVTISEWGRQIMNDINEGTPARFSEAMAEIDPESVWDDNNFRERMKDLRVTQRTKARRVLYPLYRYVHNDLTDAKNLTLEHVLPESDQFISDGSLNSMAIITSSSGQCSAT